MKTMGEGRGQVERPHQRPTTSRGIVPASSLRRGRSRTLFSTRYYAEADGSDPSVSGNAAVGATLWASLVTGESAAASS